MALFSKDSSETTETQEVEVKEQPKKRKPRKQKAKTQESPSENQGVTKSFQTKGPSTMATNKEYLRNFMIYRIHTTEVDTHDIAYDIVGRTYPFDRHDPQEVKSLEKWIYNNGTRVGIDLGVLSTTTTGGSITTIGGTPGDYVYEITVGDDGFTNFYSPDANTLLTPSSGETAFFIIEFLLSNNPNAYFQNFSGCDNVTSFYNGDGQSIGKVAFQYTEGSGCSTGPGSTEENKFKAKIIGEVGSKVILSNLKVYKVVPN